MESVDVKLVLTAPTTLYLYEPEPPKASTFIDPVAAQRDS